MQQYLSVFKLINKYYWKSFSGPFFTFLFPILWVAMIGTIFAFSFSGMQIFTPALIIPGATAISIISTSVVALPLSIVDFRQTQTLKRIGSTKVTPTIFVLTIIFFYFILMSISYILTVGMTILTLMREMDSVILIYQSANYAELLFTLVVTCVMGGSIGFLIATFCYSPMSVQACGLFILLISFILAGLGIPYALVHDYGAFETSWLWYISYIDPFHFTTGLATESWWSAPNEFNYYGSSIFNVYYPYESKLIDNPLIPSDWITIFNSSEKVANLVVPLAWIILANMLTLFFFKWDVRK